MPISLTYIGDPQYTEIVEATRMAHDLLQSQVLPNIIESRDKPFDDSVPVDLPLAQIAGYVRDATFTLHVDDYKHPKGRTDVGGRFHPSRPDQVDINVLALPKRRTCKFAGVIIHECIHALSRRIREQTGGQIHFSHTPNGRKGNTDTAPYWIQDQAEGMLCGITLLAVGEEPLIIEHDEAE